MMDKFTKDSTKENLTTKLEKNNVRVFRDRALGSPLLLKVETRIDPCDSCLRLLLHSRRFRRSSYVLIS